MRTLLETLTVTGLDYPLKPATGSHSQSNMVIKVTARRQRQHKLKKKKTHSWRQPLSES